MPKSRSYKRHHKSKRNNKNFLKKITRTTSRAIPIVASGIKNVGANVANITLKSRPKIEKGLGTLYDGVLTGFDLGVKGIKKGFTTVKGLTGSQTRRHR